MQTWWRSPNELDDDQRDIMRLPADGSFALRGPPGSGKTNLLLMRAAYLAKLRRNLVVIVLNRSLARFIRSGAKSYGLDPRSIMTTHSLASFISREAGADLESNLSYEEGRVKALQALQKAASASKTPIYDAILVDEAQDHSLEELQVFRALCKDLFLSADSRQMIYQSGVSTDVMQDLVEETKVLKFHYRSSPQICDLADAIGSTFSTGYERIAPTSRYPADGERETIRVTEGTLINQIEAVASRLIAQSRIYRGQLIGIMAPRNEEVNYIADRLEKDGFADLISAHRNEREAIDFDETRPICILTIHGSKGLEFQAVHLLAAETLRSCGAHQKRVAFTGVTRAKSSLSVYHSGQLPGYLDAALAPYRDQSGTADWTTIFDA